jgi:hypothetical protein
MPITHKRIIWKPTTEKYEFQPASFALFFLLRSAMVGGILAISLTTNALVHGIPKTGLTSPRAQHQLTFKESSFRTAQSLTRWPPKVKVEKKAPHLFIDCAH